MRPVKVVGLNRHLLPVEASFGHLISARVMRRGTFVVFEGAWLGCLEVASVENISASRRHALTLSAFKSSCNFRVRTSNLR